MSDLLRVGPVIGGTGTPVPLTAGLTGAQRTQDVHGRYAGAMRERRIFTMDSDSVTLAAANATKTALATAKFINGFFNPLDSGVVAEILKAVIATVSGTPGGPFFWNMYRVPGNINSAATGTIRNGRLSSAASGSKMTAQTGVIITTLPADTAVLVQYGTIGGPAAIAAAGGMYNVTDEPAGLIGVPPGYLFGIMCLAAGTTHVVQTSLTWEEVPDIQ